MLVGLSIALVGAVFVVPAGQAASGGPFITVPVGGPPVSGIFDTIKELPNVGGIGVIDNQFCTSSGPGNLHGANVMVNCDSILFPHNEMSVAVDPTNPSHIVAGSNDYELFFNGASSQQQIIAGFYTSTDGGATWFNGHLPTSGINSLGDPGVAFSPDGKTVYYSTVGFNFGQGGGFSVPSIMVSTSTDGGMSFSMPTIVAHGTGGTGVTLFNDKPAIAVDQSNGAHRGRVYVTYTQFSLGVHGAYLSSPIMVSYSDNGGKTFSAPMEISGSSATLCANPFVAANKGRCNEDQDSSPVIGADGTVYVAFENEEFQGAPNFRDQYLVVRSADGVHWNAPSQAVWPIFDGATDYPINVDGRQTLTNSEFRLGSAGNLAIDPSSDSAPASTRLYLSFSDNRFGTPATMTTPAITNVDVFVSASADGGSTWGGPVDVASGASAAGDQFFPWAAVRKDGQLFVAYKDRSYDPHNVLFGETLVTSADQGATFSAPMEVSSALSNPNDSRWFTAGGTTNGKATFIGDYEGLAIGSDGVAHPIWTDMSLQTFQSAPPGRGLNNENVFTASV